MSSVVLSGNKSDMERALLWSGKEIVFRLGGAIIREGVLEQKWLNKGIRPVDIISIIKSGGQAELAIHCIKDGYKVFNIDMLKMNKVIRSIVFNKGFDIMINKRGNIDGIAYNRCIFIMQSGTVSAKAICDAWE